MIAPKSVCFSDWKICKGFAIATLHVSYGLLQRGVDVKMSLKYSVKPGETQSKCSFKPAEPLLFIKQTVTNINRSSIEHIVPNMYNVSDS